MTYTNSHRLRLRRSSRFITDISKIIALIIVAVLLIAFIFGASVFLPSWLLYLVLGWFGFPLSYWKCVVVWLLIGFIGSCFRNNSSSNSTGKSR